MDPVFHESRIHNWFILRPEPDQILSCGWDEQPAGFTIDHDFGPLNQSHPSNFLVSAILPFSYLYFMTSKAAKKIFF